MIFKKQTTVCKSDQTHYRAYQCYWLKTKQFISQQIATKVLSVDGAFSLIGPVPSKEM